MPTESPRDFAARDHFNWRIASESWAFLLIGFLIAMILFGAILPNVYVVADARRRVMVVRQQGYEASIEAIRPGAVVVIRIAGEPLDECHFYLAMRRGWQVGNQEIVAIYC